MTDTLASALVTIIVRTRENRAICSHGDTAEISPYVISSIDFRRQAVAFLSGGNA
jgi:hypothetical protein